MKRAVVTFLCLWGIFLTLLVGGRLGMNWLNIHRSADAAVAETDLTEEVFPTESKTTAKPIATRLCVEYSVPLDKQIQEAVVELCTVYKLSPSLVYAMIWQESSFREDAVNYNGTCYGLMQIHQINFAAYDLEDPFDPLENVRVGIQILKECFDQYGDVQRALIAYNNGIAGAQRLFDQGIYETPYSIGVMDKWDVIESEGVRYYVEENQS